MRTRDYMERIITGALMLLVIYGLGLMGLAWAAARYTH